mgnify:CR=1 FL=1
MKEDLLKIIEHYGVNAQQRQFAEEVFELQEAILTRELHWHYDTEIQDIRPLDNHIAEEIADVTVMLKQFQYYYGIENEFVLALIKGKVDRQLERIQNEVKE